tara:strand:- start:59285 stop:60754 length:1470 start_codon:yes stop_codon:yes gene_type:complete
VRSESTYFACILLTFILVTASLSEISFAQNRTKIDLGISWEAPSSTKEISDQLSFYHQIDVQFIELSHPVSSTVLDSISNYPFQVLIRFDNKFLITSEVLNNRAEIVNQYKSLILQYSEYESIIGYGLYSFSQSFDSEFIGEFESISSELSEITNREFYEITSGPFNALDFSIFEIQNDSVPDNISAFLLSKTYSLNDHHLLNQLFKRNPTLLFINSEWLKAAISEYQPLKKALLDYNTESEFILPLPQKVALPISFNWAVVIFLGIWITLGIHISVSQTYKPLIFRFFTGHRFFVDDIMRYRERSYVSGVFLLLQHSLFSGLVVYVFSSLLISKIGLEALFASIPQLALFGRNYFSLFIDGVLFSLLGQLIALVWLFFPSKSMTHFSQALTMFTWIFHLDFLIVSIMLILLLSGGSANLILFLGFLFLINWLLAFFLTAFDSSKYLIQKRVSYMLYTFGLYSLVNVMLLILIFSSEFLFDLLELIIVL